MKYAIAFDVYGTLVDPLAMNERLRPLVGERAERFAEVWREKQVEYAFRRGLMRRYENFGVCTRDALRFAAVTLKIEISEQDEIRLLETYQNLPAFADVAVGLETLRASGHQLVAFSNGTARTVRTLLERAEVLRHLENVISVDDLKTFKPNPDVYEYLAARVGRTKQETWLVSGNAWDVIGAKSAGLKAAWVQRSPDKMFDTWGIAPDVEVTSLTELAMRLV